MVDRPPAAILEPTFRGYVATTQDALILFEACLSGLLHHVPRRPHDRERPQLVRSGCVFIYEENSSGIKRWTDGVTWSPSRILGNFLVYRELEKPFPPGEKKRAVKKNTRRPMTTTRPGEPYPRPDSNGSASTAHPYSPHPYSPASPPSTTATGSLSHQSDVERALVGSLVDSYGFKDSGLVKKTMSVSVGGVTHHLVSYYAVQDVLRGALSPPSMVESLRYVRPRPELTQNQSFRAPIDDLEAVHDASHDSSHSLYGYRPQIVGHPSYTIAHHPHPDFYGMHASYSHPPPPTAASISSGYTPMGAPLPPQPTAANPYLPAPLPPKADDYPHLRPSPFAPTAYDHNGLQSPLPATTLSGSVPPTPVSDRNRPHSEHSASTYRNSSLSSRSVGTDATSPIESSTGGGYSRASFSMANPLDGAPSSTAFDPTSIPRRESNPISPTYYGGIDRHPYYVGAPGPHPGYVGTQPMPAWTTAAPAQPQI